MKGAFLVLRFSMSVAAGSVCGPRVQYVRRYWVCVCVCVDLGFSMSVVTGSVRVDLQFSMSVATGSVCVDLWFSMSVVTGSVCVCVCGPTAQYVRRYRECLCGPTVQYVRRHKKCPWSYGSLCTSLQGALLVIRIRTPSVKGKVLDWSYSSVFP